MNDAVVTAARSLIQSAAGSILLDYRSRDSQDTHDEAEEGNDLVSEHGDDEKWVDRRAERGGVIVLVGGAG